MPSRTQRRRTQRSIRGAQLSWPLIFSSQRFTHSSRGIWRDYCMQICKRYTTQYCVSLRNANVFFMYVNLHNIYSVSRLQRRHLYFGRLSISASVTVACAVALDFFFLENALPPNSNNHILCFATKSRPLTIAINRTIPTQTTVTSERQSITLWQAILSSHAESPSSASARHFLQAGVPRCGCPQDTTACAFDGSGPK